MGAPLAATSPMMSAQAVGQANETKPSAKALHNTEVIICSSETATL